MLNVLLSSAAEKFLRKCESQIRNRIVQRIEKLQVDPFPTDAKRIVGRKELLYRVRVGDYRVLYVVVREKSEIFIADIDKRSRVYD